jgi:4-aminobutyrate aminotransferase-like enzyme/Ser/Thr protein kinase RdoA (MazF antagonist)
MRHMVSVRHIMASGMPMNPMGARRGTLPIDHAEAARTVAQLYGMCGRVDRLASERDQTLRFTAAAGGYWILKIYQPAENEAVIAFQLGALRHLEQHAPALPVPRVISTLGASSYALHRFSDGTTRIVSMLSFLEGEPLDHSRGTPSQAERLGEVLANLGRALQGFEAREPAHDQLWDLSHAAAALPLAAQLTGPSRALVESVLTRFESDIQPKLERLPSQVIHHDFNPDNLLTARGDPDSIAGVIDFGDLMRAPRVNDLAVALAYRVVNGGGVATNPAFLRGYERLWPLSSDERALLPELVRARLAMTVAISEWRARRHPENAGYLRRFRGPALDCLEQWRDSSGVDLSRRMGLERPLLERRARLLGPAYRLFYDEPLHLTRGEGVWLYDAEGNRYLDAYNNVAAVGHTHPRVVDAISRQTAVLNTHTRYLHTRILDYAEALLGSFPAPLSQVMFTCTGSEANDLAVRIAHAVTGGTGIIVTEHAYHGVTSAVSAFSPSLGSAMPAAPHVRTVPAPDARRGSAAEVGEQLGRAVRLAVADLARHGVRPAMFIVDTIFSSDGIFPEPAGFLRPAVAAIRQAGGLFVADEVQPGFGRTGEHLWGFDRHGVVPDLVTLGKPMGNGYPLAGLVASADVLDEFSRLARYFNTFGGNPVAAAAGLAVLEVIRDERLLDNARTVGAYMRDGLTRLAERQPLIGDVRGAGLFIGVELVNDDAENAAARVINALRARGVLIGGAGRHANVLKIRPPLVFTREHADVLLTTLDDVLEGLE